MSYFNVKEQVEKYKKLLNDSVDFSSRTYRKENQEVSLIFLKSIIDQELLSNAVFLPLQTYEGTLDIDIMQNKILKCAEVKEIEEEKVIDEILNGRVIIFTNFSSKIIAIDLFKFPTRVPTEPPTSPVIQGPREGFVEDIQTNITLIRRRLKTDNLVIKSLEIGTESKNKVAMCYLKDVA